MPTMVSEFVHGQTQTTSQDHFLQASEPYTISSIVNFNLEIEIAPSKPIQKNTIGLINNSWILQHSLSLKNC